MGLVLRPARPQDMELLYRWANDPVTRQNSFHPEQIPYDVHKKWFADCLEDRETIIYICMDADEPVGQLRFHMEGEDALISYSIDAGKRGRGLGTKLLELSEECLRAERSDVSVLRGRVKYGNDASMRAFERNGYRREEQDEWVEYIKRVR